MTERKHVTVASALDDLSKRGYTESFEVEGNRLLARGKSLAFAPRDVVVREHYRFEGASDPSEMAIVYAIEGPDGVRGTLLDAFGTYSSGTVSGFMKDVPIRLTGSPDVKVA
jgi:hypothetical protein